MNEYHKINSLYKRDPSGKQVLWGQWSQPEFEYLAGNEWQFTEKVDGTNIRVIWDGHKVDIRGKTDAATLHRDLVANINAMLPETLVGEVFTWDQVCLYGEGYGAGIQKGGVYRPDKSFVLFDVKVGDYWLRRPDVEDVAAKLAIDVVPVIGSGTLTDMEAMVREGFRSRWGDFTAEGIVARPTCELRTRDGKRIITKLKHRDFK